MFVNTSPLEILVCAKLLVETCDCLILVVSTMLFVLLEASTVLEFVFMVPSLVMFINPGTFDETGDDKELEGRCPSSRVCSLRPGSPWLA